MRSFFPIIVPVVFVAQTVSAIEATSEGCMAPDSKHEVVLFPDDDPDSGEYKLAIRVPGADKPLYSRLAGGYARFSAATAPANFKCLWSPDSKFVAVFERGTKRSGDTSIYLVSGDKVQEIAFPDPMPLIRPYLTAEIRASWIRPEVWLPDHELILSVEGTQMDEEHGNYRFILTLQLRSDKRGKVAAKMTSFRQDRSIDFSIK